MTLRWSNEAGAPVDRRTFLRRSGKFLGGAAMLGVASPALLAACGGDNSSGSGSGNFGNLNFQLPWIKNVESAGEFIADTDGVYKKYGFSSVKLIAAGPNATPQETVIKTGQALVGVTSLDSTAAAIQKGFNLVVIGTQYQKNPFCIMSLKSNPIATPQDMVGKKIGVQSVNDAVWAAFLKANSLDPSSITKVAVSFDPTPLTQGTVDGWFSFITNEPIDLGIKNVETTTFLLNDYNYPEIGNVYIATTDTVKNDRDKLKAAMAAELDAWQVSIKDPAKGATLAATKYGQGLDASEQTKESVAQNDLIATGDAKTAGLFYITPDAQTKNIATLALGGTTVTADQLFDLTVLDDVYKDHPSLKTCPTPGTA